MNSKTEWQNALKESPDDRTLQFAYADWLEEQGEQLLACQVRQAGGGGTLVYSLWHPSWGAKRYGAWTKLAHLKSHVEPKGRSGWYRRTHATKEVPVGELVVVIEWRANPVEVTRLPYSRQLEA